MKLTIQDNGYAIEGAFYCEHNVDPVAAFGIIRDAKLTGFDWVGIYLPKFGLDFTARPDAAIQKISRAIDKMEEP